MKSKSDPVYTTEHQPMTLKDFRVLFHGCDVSATVLVEVEGLLYQPVAVVDQVANGRVLIQLEPIERG